MSKAVKMILVEIAKAWADYYNLIGFTGNTDFAISMNLQDLVNANKDAYTSKELEVVYNGELEELLERNIELRKKEWYK